MAKREQRTELMVGIFIFFGLLFLTWMIVFFGDKSEHYDSVYTIEIAFEDASGVGKGTPVQLAGAPVGRVSAAPKLEAGIMPKIRVPVEINGNRQLPTDAVFQIESATVLGDKVITIQIPENHSSELLTQGDVVAGSGAGGFDALQKDIVAIAGDARFLMSSARISLNKFDSAMDDVRLLTTELNQAVTQLNSGVLTDRNIATFERTLTNIEDASLGARNATSELAPVLAEARTTMTNINSLAQKAEGTFETLDRELANVGPALQEAPRTMQSIRRTVDQAGGVVAEVEKTFAKANDALDSLSGDSGLLGTLTSDEGIGTDTKTFVRNLRRYGILGYKDEATDEDDPRERYRGRRR